MMTAKAQGKDRVVVFEDAPRRAARRRDGGRDLRSIAHLKLLQSLAREAEPAERRAPRSARRSSTSCGCSIDYHNCIVYLLEGEQLAARSRSAGSSRPEDVDRLEFQLGEGLTGHVAETGKPMLVANVLESDLCLQLTEGAGDESLASVPLRHGQRVDRRDHAVEARRRPVRRGRPAAARGARRPRVGRARERAALRVAPPRGREREGVARVLRRSLRGALGRGDRRRRPFRRSRSVMEVEQASLWIEDAEAGNFRCLASARVRRRSARSELCPGCGRAGRAPCA